MKAKRKTLNAGDVLAAMEEMEFERFLQPLREALEGQYSSQDTEYKFMLFRHLLTSAFPLQTTSLLSVSAPKQKFVEMQISQLQDVQ